MYFIGLKFDRHEVKARNLSNPNAHHGMLWRFFKHLGLPRNGGGERVFLHRGDQVEDGMEFVATSRWMPNVEAIDGIEISVSEVDVSMMPQGPSCFRAKISPTVRSNGDRLPLPDNKVESWFESKLVGVAILHHFDFVSSVQYGWRGGKRLTHNCVNAVGVLEVKDSEGFIKIMMDGIGSGKSQGFGLVLPALGKEGRMV